MVEQATNKPLAPLTDAQSAVLERNLFRQLDLHEQLHEALAQKRQAIREADMQRIGTISEREQKLVGEMTTLEQQRIAMLNQLRGASSGDGSAPPRLRDLLARVGEPARERLGAVADRLRETLEAIRQESAVLREAAEQLNRHVGGVVQSMQAALSRSGLYQRHGKIAAAPRPTNNIDLRS